MEHVATKSEVSTSGVSVTKSEDAGYLDVARHAAFATLHTLASRNGALRSCLSHFMAQEHEHMMLARRRKWATDLRSILNQVGDVMEVAPRKLVLPSAGLDHTRRNTILLVRSGAVEEGRLGTSLHREGAVLGEHAFLSGQAPIDYWAADTDASAGSPTAIVFLEFASAMRLTESEPSLMHTFFHSLAADLAQRLVDQGSRFRSFWVAEHARSSITAVKVEAIRRRTRRQSSDSFMSVAPARLHNMLAGPSQQPPAAAPLILVTNVGKQVTDDLALVLCSALVDASMINLLGVIANEAPVKSRARGARAILDLLGLDDVPVALGCGSEEGVDGPSKLTHELREGDGAEATTLLERAYAMAAPNSITLLLLSSLTEAADFIRQFPNLFAEKTARVVVMGGVMEDSLTDPASLSLKPDPTQRNLAQDVESAHIVYSEAQRLRVPLVITTRFVPYMAPLVWPSTLIISPPIALSLSLSLSLSL
eukprot:CAMPEP_0174718008 /NCGR_PEP_ID=MMETSP1094-20130205/27795_1 /TAXON_ID=156173 /ORGANISM="Chrysochromulina brevifilum, Strain UTEX LB 985" /LENGTH=479 /DNA_ID=CAMNT_0015918019 /DNA_START=40 /DNA_END=1476 /DNA_ORIENTATION=-